MLVIKEQNVKISKGIGALAALISALSLLIGLLGIYMIAPEFYQNAEARMQVFDKYGRFVQLWYFIVWIIFAVGILISHFALLHQDVHHHNLFEHVITLACFIACCYFLSIGLIEILSAELVLSNALTDQGEPIFREALSFLRTLRQSTEFSGDIWLMLINVHLLKHRLCKHYVAIMGICVAVLGFVVLLPSAMYLGPLYVMLFASWLLIVAQSLLQQ